MHSSISSSEAVGIKRLLCKLVFFLPLLGFIGATNVLVDPINLYRSYDYDKGIAALLLSGKNVARPDLDNDRLVERYFIEGQRAAPDIVVIGSCRSYNIGTNIFPHVNIINSAQGAASMGDYLSVLFDYDQRGMLPKKIILGIDPWFLNPNSGEIKWVASKEQALGMLKKLGVRSWDSKAPWIGSRRLMNIFSLSYFQTAIQNFIAKAPKASAYAATDQEIADDYDIWLKDGRVSSSRMRTSTPAQEIREEAKTFALVGTGLYFALQKPDAQWAGILERMISYLQSKHVEVMFFLSPYHPVIYQSLVGSAKNKVIVDVENYYREIAKKYHLKVIGSYDPERCRLTENDFFDPYHAKREGIEKIFQRFDGSTS